MAVFPSLSPNGDVAPTYTIDASVFVNAFNPHEEGHEASRELLAFLLREGIEITVPTLLFPEIAAAVARGRDDTDLARKFADALGNLPYLVEVWLDGILAHQAKDVASEYRLRGSDAVYGLISSRKSGLDP